MALSTPTAFLACTAAGAIACAAIAHPDTVPIDICLTVGHPHPCVNLSDADGDGWAIVELAPGQSYPDFRDGTTFRVTGMYCTSCIQWFCGSFEGNIFQAVIHPTCPVIGDASGDGSVNVDDLLAVIGAWGPCASPCDADLNIDAMVNIDDLLIVINNWA
jgi:hypothetical protein